MKQCPECKAEIDYLVLYVKGWKTLFLPEEQDELVEEKDFLEAYDAKTGTAECPKCEEVILEAPSEKEIIRKGRLFFGSTAGVDE